MIEIDINNINELHKLNLHDSEVSNFICKYEESLLDLPIDHYYLKKQAILRFSNILHTEISFYRPFGIGYYVFCCELNEQDEAFEKIKMEREKLKNEGNLCYTGLSDYESLDTFFSVTITLNSGDKIKVITNKISLIEDVIES